jgi:tRNA dimethylallyltransferase
LPSLRAVVYRLVLEHLAGRTVAGTMRDRAIAATRQLAKRQITWLRAMDVETLDCFSTRVAQLVCHRVANACAGVAARA